MGTDEETKVAQLLLEHWDVIGVRDVDEQPESEYLHEAAQVLDLLRQGAAREELSEYLSGACRSLHAHANSARDENAAAAVADWYADRA